MNIARAQRTILPSLPFSPLSIHPNLSKLKQPNSLLLSSYSKRLKLLRWIVRAETNQSLVPVNSNNGRNPSEFDETTRPPFDINMAVVLAGFAFEAYTNPPDKFGWREIDEVDCETIFLSEQFLREIYDGQLCIKVKKGLNLPIMDPWGTSDPYVVLKMDGQVAKTNIKWASKEPVWNEDLALNISKSRAKILKVETWDANLLTPHKCMGKTELNLESLCDGKLHDLAVELVGSTSGAKIQLEVRYKTYEEIQREKEWWKLPFVSDFIIKSNLGTALNSVLGSDTINVTQFVESAFGQLNSFAFFCFPKSQNTENPANSQISEKTENSEVKIEKDENIKKPEDQVEKVERSDEEYFWEGFTGVINQMANQRLGLSLPEIKLWDGFELLNSTGLQSRQIADKEYVESGLASPEILQNKEEFVEKESKITETPSSFLDIKKASLDMVGQTETLFGALMVLATSLSQMKKEESKKDEEELNKEETETVVDESGNIEESLDMDAKKREEMKLLFSKAESAMEAWAMLATSLGRPSFIKSDFVKICFLDNISTDTQVAIWRDSVRMRMVIAFRGTEQTKWKDLQTDLLVLPTRLNPERMGGDIKEEVQVHTGFLSAYDSVRNRIITLLKFAIGYHETAKDEITNLPLWQVYVTGHSLGGALATLLALELSTSQMAEQGVISVTMYNFGSPRVGNRRFAEVYNSKVKDSWRVVNHRDIIPTVPRLLGYCHVAEPMYLTRGDLKDTLKNQADVMGESTPDTLVSEFLKGERQLIEKILETEINLLLSLRDGSALMQHMEDFYYVTLLESVKTNDQIVSEANSKDC